MLLLGLCSLVKMPHIRRPHRKSGAIVLCQRTIFGGTKLPLVEDPSQNTTCGIKPGLFAEVSPLRLEYFVAFKRWPRI